jgi:uncharacterized membrane protein SpoIIM required for sporulation
MRLARWPFGLALATYAGGIGAGAVLGRAITTVQALNGVRLMPRVDLDATAYLSHNLLVAGVLVGGGLTLGLVTALVLFGNGVALGTTAALVQARYGWVVLMAGTFPHGLFEAAGLVSAAALGFLLAGRMAAGARRLLRGRGGPSAWRAPDVVAWIGGGLAAVVALMVIAAVAEAEVTANVLLAFIR